MIELTDQQIQAMATSANPLAGVVNPRTGEEFILIPREDYQRLLDGDYDDTLWTRAELQGLAWPRGNDDTGWSEYDEPAAPSS